MKEDKPMTIALAAATSKTKKKPLLKAIMAIALITLITSCDNEENQPIKNSEMKSMLDSIADGKLNLSKTVPKTTGIPPFTVNILAVEEGPLYNPVHHINKLRNIANTMGSALTKEVGDAYFDNIKVKKCTESSENKELYACTIEYTIRNYDKNGGISNKIAEITATKSENGRKILKFKDA